jgi:DNA polymerase V
VALPKGFAGSFDDSVASSLDLNELLIHSPSSTYFMKIDGDGQVDVGAEDGDIAIVDRALTPINGDLVVVVIDGELILKQFQDSQNQTALISRSGENTILITEHSKIEFWGVLTASIKQFRK